MNRPNIVYLHSHDTGRYVQPYGHAIPTPNLQRFAEQGVLFRRAFTVNPTCSPSRAALLTGTWPHCSGMMGLAHRGFRLSDYRQHLVNTLKPAGYHTAVVGVHHVGIQHAPEGLGYDEMLDARDKGGVHKAAADFIARSHDKPFFLACGFFNTHRKDKGFNDPPAGEPRTDPRYVKPPAPLPDTTVTRQDMAEFIDDARSLDAVMGHVIEAVDKAGLRDSTLIIVTTDHGIAFPHMKCNLTDHGLGVMLMLRGPGGFEGGRVLDAMVTHMDLFPTLCDLADVPHPDWLAGKSLLPLLHGEVDALHGAVFAEVNYHAAYEPKRAVRTERFKLIRQYGNHLKPVLPNCDDSASKTCLLEHGWAEIARPREVLFDLVMDPNEAGNRIDDPAYATVADELCEKLDAWMRLTNDPILPGPIPLPQGAVANDPAGRSPGEEADWKPPSR